jgi:hypothetical protein
MRALTLVLAAVLSACQPSGAQFRTTSVMDDGTYPMPVVLGDQTGLVAGIEPALAVGFVDVPSVQPDPDDPNVVVSWGTGACDDGTWLWSIDRYVIAREVRDSPARDADG